MVFTRDDRPNGSKLGLMFVVVFIDVSVWPDNTPDRPAFYRPNQCKANSVM